jgi:hypothetical protein
MHLSLPSAGRTPCRLRRHPSTILREFQCATVCPARTKNPDKVGATQNSPGCEAWVTCGCPTQRG